MNIRQYIKYLPTYLFFFILLLATVKYPFFWDTVQLASKHAHFFYETDFHSIILPNEIDSGHIPTLGIYLAAEFLSGLPGHCVYGISIKIVLPFLATLNLF